jgi:hypothetical protein
MLHGLLHRYCRSQHASEARRAACAAPAPGHLALLKPALLVVRATPNRLASAVAFSDAGIGVGRTVESAIAISYAGYGGQGRRGVPALGRLIFGIVPGGLTKEQSEAVFRHDTEAFAAGIKAAGITPPQ